ncbi:hypothetical protein LJ656_14840 [Paraburkholderia sp. MMS20-SJTR3]|uniref:Uncharacterized protein n=1 Tax=Paraburkholderia sejongensis TaxID=2886946 RepID=A0ABS8JVF7_9BURK|nr:hypothetical protein [Paraburkholderia sp. MMS20-SJTR3]MCC8393872.1 hypothetical protein [Paraburkholderia sp. MMS20-SJTR3]
MNTRYIHFSKEIFRKDWEAGAKISMKAVCNEYLAFSGLPAPVPIALRSPFRIPAAQKQKATIRFREQWLQ